MANIILFVIIVIALLCGVHVRRDAWDAYNSTPPAWVETIGLWIGEKQIAVLYKSSEGRRHQ